MTIKEIRNIIFCRDGNKCYKCGSMEMLCLDHVIPKPKYQIHCIDNLLTLCWRCNFKKGISILPVKELQKIYLYLHKVNSHFSLIKKIEMNIILYEYFINGSNLKKKRQLPIISKSKYKYSNDQIQDLVKKKGEKRRHNWRIMDINREN